MLFTKATWAPTTACVRRSKCLLVDRNLVRAPRFRDQLVSHAGISSLSSVFKPWTDGGKLDSLRRSDLDFWESTSLRKETDLW